MKLVNFKSEHQNFEVGALVEDRVYSLTMLTSTVEVLDLYPDLTSWIDTRKLSKQHNMREWLELRENGEGSYYDWQEVAKKLVNSPDTKSYALHEVSLKSAFPQPHSLRDFYAFETHVATAYANRGAEVPPEWYQIPVFYFSNHGAIFGPDDTIPYPRSSHALDYELEVACVIGKGGKNIMPENAMDHIFGFTIMNDWSARDVQRQEMKVGLGPAKGKDFATSLGPWLVTPDELTDRAIEGRPGVYDLTMIARVNGEERSRGNWKDLHYTFGQMLARASEDVTLYPGDVIGSGTVGTGCLLEITRGQGPWLQSRDVVELEIERLGTLRNIVGKGNR